MGVTEVFKISIFSCFKISPAPLPPLLLDPCVPLLPPSQPTTSCLLCPINTPKDPELGTPNPDPQARRRGTERLGMSPCHLWMLRWTSESIRRTRAQKQRLRAPLLQASEHNFGACPAGHTKISGSQAQPGHCCEPRMLPPSLSLFLRPPPSSLHPSALAPL